MTSSISFHVILLKLFLKLLLKLFLNTGDGAIGRVSHQSRVANGTETQTAAGPPEGMGLSKVGGCFDGVRDEDDSGVRSDLPADDRGVRCN
jgi:hypothetical protein